jgi:hypothetical protein
MNWRIRLFVMSQGEEAVIQMVGWVFQVDEQNFALCCVASEEGFAFGDAYGFMPCKAGFTMLRLCGNNAERAVGQQPVDEVRDTFWFSVDEGTKGLEERKPEFGLGGFVSHFVWCLSGFCNQNRLRLTVGHPRPSFCTQYASAWRRALLRPPQTTGTSLRERVK